MTAGIQLILASETTEGGGADPLVWGISAFVILIAMLLIVLALGRGRS